MRFLLFLFSFIFLLTACQDGADNTEKKPQEAPAPTKKYTLTPFTNSPAYGDAKIEGVTYKAGQMDFKLAEGTSYQLGAQTTDAPQKNCANSAKGQHIHAIVNDKPYAARYTSSFNDLRFGDGDHKMLAFLSRSYHESIKTMDAHTALNLTIKDSSIVSSSPIVEPMVWYSRPKGTYKGKANTDKIMLDFYLINTNLNGGNLIKADINGEIHMIGRWQPYYIEGLPMGKNTITLSLVDRNGVLVEAPQNPISRTFTLEADPTEQ